MTRYFLLLLLLALSPAAAVAVVPPVPRVVLPPLPPPDDPAADPESADDPAKVAERIARNAKSLGDRLAKEDTGPDTLTGQEKLKRDIDSLIKALENPPPMDNQQGQQGQQGQQNKSGQQSQGGGQPMGGTGRNKPMGGSSGQGKQQGQPMPQGGQPGGQQPQGGKPDPKNGQPGQPGGEQMKDGTQPGGGGMAKPALPLDEAIARDFWGNLPDLPRQRMLQFFREQYMSRYKELLPQYYQSLAEKEKKMKK